MATVEETDEFTTGSQSTPVEKKDCGITRGIGITSSGQIKRCRLCLGEYYNIDECKFASKVLATIRETNIQSQHGIRRRIPGVANRCSHRFIGRF